MNDLEKVEIFCKNVRDICYERGIELKDFENSIGIKRGYILRLCKGCNKDVGYFHVKRIEEGLGMPFDDILHWNRRKEAV